MSRAGIADAPEHFPVVESPLTSHEPRTHAGGGLIASIRAGGRDVWSLWRRWGLACAVLLLIACCWDRAVYLHVSVGAGLGDPTRQQELKHALESGWLLRLFKGLGELYVAMFIAVGLVLIDWARLASAGGKGGEGGEGGEGGATLARVMRRATAVMLTPALAGLLAELCKGLARRERPLVALDEHALGGWFHFRWWWDGPFDWSNLGFGSSHAAVGMGLALALGGVWPRSRMIAILLALGVGYARVLCGAHFLSDVLMGYFCAATAWAFVRSADAVNNPGVGLADPSWQPQRDLAAARTPA